MPRWYYNWFMKKAEPSRGICCCGCTNQAQALYELAIFIIFKKDIS